MNEMKRRSYRPDTTWYEPNYRGKELGVEDGWANFNLIENLLSKSEAGTHIYEEHNTEYYTECIENLRMKGIDIDDRL
jgi:uncharacterized protein (TIGR02328 family)